MKERDFRIDLLRAFACIMVLFCHAPQHYTGQPGSFLGAIDTYYTMAWGPILFFAISGVCLLGGDREAIPFLKKRFSRILFPTIFWSIVYIILQCYVWKTIPQSQFWYMIPSMLVKPQYGLMWFMYALISLYLMVPILSRWLNSCKRQEVLFYLAIWSITLIIPYFDVLGTQTESLVVKNGMLFYMSGFLWCAVAGFYCQKWVRWSFTNKWHLFYTVVILLSPAYILLLQQLGEVNFDTSLTFFSMATTLFAIIFVYSVNITRIAASPTLNTLVSHISKYSFGIYLFHMVILFPFKQWIGDYNLNYAIQIPITVLVVAPLSYLASWGISKLPFGKYIIG